jgi:methylglutaconyl-CoA hydratase
VDPPLAEITLDDPQRRNALGTPMFDAIFQAIEQVQRNESVHVVLLCGSGKTFCSGFDVKACAEDASLLETFILRLGELLKTLRRMPQVVVAAVQGAAIAGGCAMVSACDLVVVSRQAKLGYPVHRLGLSPAVTTSTLTQKIGAGRAREVLMGGRLIDGSTAFRWGLAYRLADDDESVLADGRALARTIAGHGSQALRTTKRWLNELDGSLDAGRTDRPARHSAGEAEEARTLLPEFLRARTAGDAPQE